VKAAINITREPANPESQTGRPESGIFTKPDTQSTSSRLWGLEWKHELPWDFDDGRVEYATKADVLPFIRAHYPSIFGLPGSESRFLPSPMTPAKDRFFDEMDYFAFYVEDKTVGVFMSHPLDWSTYYLRSTAILPEYRDRGLMSRFFEALEAPLLHVGVERIEADCSPLNTPIVRVMNSHGYFVSGSVASERWGFVSRYTKLISESARSAFLRQYAAMPVSDRRSVGSKHQS
jgi:GNAT superfamily N-acetyltransferase